MDALRMEGVHVAFPGRPAVLRDAHLQVPAGHLAVLRGRSGSGKTTLLHVAAGLLAPGRGDVTILDKPISPEVRGAHIGIVFQHLNLMPEMTARENIELPLRLDRWPKAKRQSRVDGLLERFQIQDLAQRIPQKLSGGEQARVAIARALAKRPGLLLVDEPTASLDDELARDVVRALEVAAKSGAGVLVTSHDEILHTVGTQYRMLHGRPVRGGT